MNKSIVLKQYLFIDIYRLQLAYAHIDVSLYFYIYFGERKFCSLVWTFRIPYIQLYAADGSFLF